MTASLTVLIVEDEPLIAMMLEDFIESIGHKVAATADNVADALAAVARGGFDMAILDVHLRGGEPSWPVADALADGGYRFVLATGGMTSPPPARHAAARELTKPFTMNDVQAAIENIAA